MGFKYTDDDYCDIYENKICDNCGKCLELDGVDIKAIKIDEIAKTKEENKVLEEEFLNDLKSSLTEEDLNEIKEQDLNLSEIYKRYSESIKDTDFNFDSEIEGEYEDAFEHMEYIEDLSDVNNADFDEMTEEIYPGVRRIKKINK